MAGAGLAYLNSAAGDDLDPAALGEMLTALGDLQDKIAAAHATVLRRFDAADAHDADGYGSSSAWLAARGRMTRRDARAAVRQMRQFSQRPALHEAVAAGDLSRSWADAIARWTAKLPVEMRDEADKILLQAATAGATLEDLATIATAAIEQWRSAQPDPGAATGPPQHPTCITSSTRATAARPRSGTAPRIASSTTRPVSTDGAGRSPSIPTAPAKPAVPTADRSCETTPRQTGARHEYYSRAL